MRKKMKFAVLGLSLAASLAVGTIAFAAESDNNSSHMNNDSMSTMNSMMKDSSMSDMMKDSSMSDMMKDSSMSDMMKDSSMSDMMKDAMKSPEGQEMVKSCNKFMESSQDKEGQPDSKDNGLKSKQTSL